MTDYKAGYEAALRKITRYSGVIRDLENDNARLRARLHRANAALRKIASFEDELASDHLRETGSYSRFDEPGSVYTARTALAFAALDETEDGDD